MMEYYIVLGHNDALSELTDLRSPFFFDDFNDMCTVVIIKKNWHVKVLHATHLTFEKLIFKKKYF